MTPRPVLLVSHSGSYSGGAEFVFVEAISVLRAADIPVVAILPHRGALFQDAATLGANTYAMSIPWWCADHPRWRFRGRAKLAFQLSLAIFHALRCVRRHRPAVVVTNTLTAPSFAIASWVARVPHVWMVQEFGTRDHGFRFLLGHERTIRLIGSLSRTVICCSRAVEESLLEVAPSISTRVVYYGIQSTELPFRPRQPGPLRAVLLGRFGESKGQELAVEALAKARHKGADIELTLVGSGRTEEVRRLATTLGIGQHVACKPHTDDTGAVWRDADVALMCSREEAFGRVTVEAMKAHLPVCAANSGGTREIVTHEVNGLLFAPGDSASLAANLIRLESDEELRGKLALGAAQTASTFSMTRYGQELIAAIFT